MDEFVEALKRSGFMGEIDAKLSSREQYAHDASMFEILPKLIVAPKDAEDIRRLVRIVGAKRGSAKLSMTVRSAGTDMSGGAINDSIIIDMTPHFNKIESVHENEARVQPGVFYRDFEKETLLSGGLLPCYPASRELCTVGGMVANNAGGEKSLQFGKTERFVRELKVVLSDGNEYSFGPLDKAGLEAKMAQNDFEGKVYRAVFALINNNYKEIKTAQPKVSKDSTAYHLWNVWDRDKGTFDLTQVLAGSQGTLGIITDIKFQLVPPPKHSGTLVIFLRDLDQLGDIINVVLDHKPATFEGFDNYTLMLSFKLFYYFHTTLGWFGMLKLALQLLPDALMLFKGIPKMVLLVEFNGDNPQDVAAKVHRLRVDLRPFDSKESYEEDETEAKAKKFWIMRRESFNLLRKKVHDKHTAPFIDDLVVPPQYLPEFLPKLREIVNRYGLLATVAGHMGDGNFHVIPLMKFEEEKERAKILPVMKEVNELVLKYKGSLSGEHNDGMSRGPWLGQMYSPSMMDHFKEIKHIFDPNNIFNPHKKTDANWEYSMSHLREHF